MIRTSALEHQTWTDAALLGKDMEIRELRNSLNVTRAMLRSIAEVLEEHEAYRDATSMERVCKHIPWIREALSQ